MNFLDRLYNKSVNKRAEAAENQIKGIQNQLTKKPKTQKTQKIEITKDPKVVKSTKVNPLNISQIKFDTFVQSDSTPAEKDKAKRVTERNQSTAERMAKAVEEIAKNTKKSTDQDTSIKKKQSDYYKHAKEATNKVFDSFKKVKNDFMGSIWDKIQGFLLGAAGLALIAAAVATALKTIFGIGTKVVQGITFGAKWLGKLLLAPAWLAAKMVQGLAAGAGVVYQGAKVVGGALLTAGKATWDLTKFIIKYPMEALGNALAFGKNALVHGLSFAKKGLTNLWEGLKGMASAAKEGLSLLWGKAGFLGKIGMVGIGLGIIYYIGKALGFKDKKYVEAAVWIRKTISENEYVKRGIEWFKEIDVNQKWKNGVLALQDVYKISQEKGIWAGIKSLTGKFEEGFIEAWGGTYNFLKYVMGSDTPFAEMGAQLFSSTSNFVSDLVTKLEKAGIWSWAKIKSTMIKNNPSSAAFFGFVDKKTAETIRKNTVHTKNNKIVTKKMVDKVVAIYAYWEERRTRGTGTDVKEFPKKSGKNRAWPSDFIYFLKITGLNLAHIVYDDGKRTGVLIKFHEWLNRFYGTTEKLQKALSKAEKVVEKTKEKYYYKADVGNAWRKAQNAKGANNARHNLAIGERKAVAGIKEGYAWAREKVVAAVGVAETAVKKVTNVFSSVSLIQIAKAIRMLESGDRYDIADYHNDAGGLSVGAYQFTSNAGWVRKLTVMAAAKGVPGAQRELDKFQGLKPAGSYKMWFRKVGATEKMKAIQDEGFKLWFYEPNRKLAQKYQITNGHMIAHVIDHNHNTGSRAASVIKNMEDKTVTGISEARKADYVKHSKKRHLKGHLNRVDLLNKYLGNGLKVGNPITSMMDKLKEYLSEKAGAFSFGAKTQAFLGMGAGFMKLVGNMAQALGVTINIPTVPTASSAAPVIPTTGGTSKSSAYSGPISPKSAILCPKAQHEPRTTTTMIVMHRTGSNGYNPKYDRKCRDGVAAHFTIDRQGGLNLDVGENLKAWHVGAKYNGRSIGIEISGAYVKRTMTYVPMTNAQKRTLKTLSLYLVKKYNLGWKNIFCHKELAPRKAKEEGDHARDYIRAVLQGKNWQGEGDGTNHTITEETAIKTATSSIQVPEGNVYLPQVGLVKRGSTNLKLLSANNKIIFTELEKIRASIKVLKTNENQDGDLVGIIPVQA